MMAWVRLDDRGVEGAPVLARLEHKEPRAPIGGRLTRLGEPIRRERPPRLVGVAIGVPQRDRAVEVVGRAQARGS